MAGFRQLDGHFLTTVPFISKVHVEGHFTLRVGIDRRLPSIDEGTVDAGLQPGRGKQLLSGRQRLVPFKHLPGSHEEGSMLNKNCFPIPVSVYAVGVCHRTVESIKDKWQTLQKNVKAKVANKNSTKTS